MNLWQRCLAAFLCVVLFGQPMSRCQIIVNEIHYNPPDLGIEDGLFREFIELYNSSEGRIDLNGYYFDNGISYTFPDNAHILPGDYIVLAKDVGHRIWRNSPFPVWGPYDGRLDNGGERLTLRNAQGHIIETLTYNDTPPWPRAADGYDASLERVSPIESANDHHSWRASLAPGGTPGAINSVDGTPPTPLLAVWNMTPMHPTSSDPVQMQVTLDGSMPIASVLLNIDDGLESRTGTTVFNENSSWRYQDGDPSRIEMVRTETSGVDATFQATLPPAPSQSLIRTNLTIHLHDGSEITLPHSAEPTPFLSYFVYDGEIESTLPLLWIMRPQVSPLLSNGRRYGAAVSLPIDASYPTLFDGVLVIPSSSRREKIRFIKGAEFFGDRTINLIPETPTGGTNAGISSPYREHLGYWFYSQMGVLSPWAQFYRTIELPRSDHSIQRQQLVFQQINERFLEMNGLDPDADLYKLERRANPRWEKHTNLAEGNASINELLDALHAFRRRTIETRFNLDNMLAYSAASLFTSNWDGYWQNHWMYLDPATACWEMYPWDLDWIWGATPPPNTGAMYAEMPLTFPIDGVAVGFTKVSRAPGPVTSPMHQDTAYYQAYIQRLADTFETTFGQAFLFAKMDEDRQRLLDDLALLNRQTGRNVDPLIQQIQQSYETIETYIVRRRAYLEPLLPL